MSIGNKDKYKDFVKHWDYDNGKKVLRKIYVKIIEVNSDYIVFENVSGKQILVPKQSIVLIKRGNPK